MQTVMILIPMKATITSLLALVLLNLCRRKTYFLRGRACHPYPSWNKIKVLLHDIDIYVIV